MQASPVFWALTSSSFWYRPLLASGLRFQPRVSTLIHARSISTEGGPGHQSCLKLPGDADMQQGSGIRPEAGYLRAGLCTAHLCSPKTCQGTTSWQTFVQINEYRFVKKLKSTSICNLLFAGYEQIHGRQTIPCTERYYGYQTLEFGHKKITLPYT